MPLTLCTFRPLELFAEALKIRTSPKPIRSCFVAGNLAVSSIEMFLWRREQLVGRKTADECTLIEIDEEDGGVGDTARTPAEILARFLAEYSSVRHARVRRSGGTGAGPASCSGELLAAMPPSLDYLFVECPVFSHHLGDEESELRNVAKDLFALLLLSAKLRKGGRFVLSVRTVHLRITADALLLLATRFRSARLFHGSADAHLYSFFVGVGYRGSGGDGDDVVGSLRAATGACLERAPHGSLFSSSSSSALDAYYGRVTEFNAAVHRMYNHSHAFALYATSVDASLLLNRVLFRLWFEKHGVRLKHPSRVDRGIVLDVLRRFDKTRQVTRLSPNETGLGGNNMSMRKEVTELNNEYIVLARGTSVKAPELWDEVGRMSKVHARLRETVSRAVGRPVSQAFLKMHEILDTFPSILRARATDRLRTLHVCEAPGQFVVCFERFIRARCGGRIRSWKWTANSLNTDSVDAFGDRYGLMRDHAGSWDFGPDGTGDVLSAVNAAHYRRAYRASVDVFTSDCGLSYRSGEDFTRREDQMAELLAAAVRLATAVVKEGGCAVIKAFMPMLRADTRRLIERDLGSRFESVSLFKPSQNMSSYEVYIVAERRRASPSRKESLSTSLYAAVKPHVERAIEHMRVKEALYASPTLRATLRAGMDHRAMDRAWLTTFSFS